jgi:2'-5' RNA ligase
VSESLRAFFAADLPGATRAQAERALEALRQAVPSGARWESPEKLHLTLKFLGSVPADRVDRLAAGALAKLGRVARFQVALAGFGAFPNARAARVLWLGVTDGAAALARVARKLDAAAARIGVPREKRPFHGHVTLGRLREPARVALERATCPEVPAFSVEEVVLYESRPSPTGSHYVPLARVPLAADGTDFEDDLAPDFQES